MAFAVDTAPPADSMDMQDKLQEVLATQNMILALLQSNDGSKEEETPVESKEKEHAKNE